MTETNENEQAIEMDVLFVVLYYQMFLQSLTNFYAILKLITMNGEIKVQIFFQENLTS